MDTKLGKISLTQNQILRLSEITSVNGLCYWHGTQELIAVSDQELTEQQKQNLINEVKSLPDLPKGISEEKLIQQKMQDIARAELVKEGKLQEK